jgi:tRNA(Arg) A34 adenosine deaminase TadA
VTHPLNGSWDQLPVGAREALEQQWLGVAAHGLPCGAAVLNRAGRLVSTGRNRAYEPATGQDPLEDTRVAHAELNALARVPTDVDHSELVVWSTQHPCAMCAAAIAFIGIGEVRYVADDPSDHHPATEIVATRAGVLYVALNDPVWWTVANLLFLYPAAEREGGAAANIAANVQRYPSLVDLALSQAGRRELGDRARLGWSLVDALTPCWPEIIDAMERTALGPL